MLSSLVLKEKSLAVALDVCALDYLIILYHRDTYLEIDLGTFGEDLGDNYINNN